MQPQEEANVQLYPFVSLRMRTRRGWVLGNTLRPLYPRERPGTHCTGGCVGPRAGLDGRGKSRPYRDSIPGPTDPQDEPQLIQATLPQLLCVLPPSHRSSSRRLFLHAYGSGSCMRPTLSAYRSFRTSARNWHSQRAAKILYLQLFVYNSYTLSINMKLNLLKPSGNFTYHRV
jgi:hypothetical protein